MKVEWYQVLSVVLFIVFVIMLLTRIFGHSATDASLIIGTFGALGSWIYGLSRDIKKLDRETGEIKVGMTHSFNKVREDFEKVNTKLDSLLKKKVK